MNRRGFFFRLAASRSSSAIGRAHFGGNLPELTHVHLQRTSSACVFLYSGLMDLVTSNGQRASLRKREEIVMKYLAFASLAVFVLITSITDASAVVCARGVYRAGCAGPRGAVVAHRGPYGHVYARGVRY